MVSASPTPAPPKYSDSIDAVVIGGSAGAVDALSAILPGLPAGYGLPVLIVIHLPANRESAIAELFQAKCRIEVKEAEDKEMARKGTAYFAPPDYHLLVERDHRLSLSSEEPVWYCRPSIDVLFESAADAFGKNLAAVVLSGANQDGAKGLKAVCEAGGMGIVQKPELAPFPVMPEAAGAICPSARAISLEEIARLLHAFGKVNPLDS